MCGIIGYIGSKPVVPLLLDGLRRMEYRGYDSAGVALVRPDGISLRRSPGKLVNLESTIRDEPVEGRYGIGHTRWATHGRPTEENAHPHSDCTGRIVVVHNGIIENYLELKRELQSQGHNFQTETDTEIVAHLVEREMRDDSLEGAVRRALTSLRGMFALVLVSADDQDKIVAVGNGPGLVVGIGVDESFVASDIPAILSHTRDVVFLSNEEMAVITPSGVAFTDHGGRPLSKPTQRVLWDPIAAEKGGHRHFMLKEIYEQPSAARETILGRVSVDRGQMFLEDLHIPDETLRTLEKVTIIACGTSWHAGLVGKYLIEALAQLPSRSTTALNTAIAVRSWQRRNSRSLSPSLARPLTRLPRCERRAEGARTASPFAMWSAAWRRAKLMERSTRTRALRSAWPRQKRSRRNWSLFTCSRSIWLSFAAVSRRRRCGHASPNSCTCRN